MANQEACELYIEQEIKSGLEGGKTPYSIGKELSGWVEKLFEVKMKPNTLKKQAQRQKDKTGQMSRNKSNKVIKTDTSKDSIFASKRGGKRAGAGRKPVFNETNESIEWARWTWNPVTGCLHGCKYCYARDIANRFYKEKFKPTFRPHRLAAPFNTPLPNITHKKDNLVFVCSMGDLFGEWVKQEWIDAVIGSVTKAPQWNFMFLTKNPERLATIDWPKNAWVGATVDVQARVERTEKAFEKFDATIKYISCEPLSEELVFKRLYQLDLVIIGARSRSTSMPEMQPDRAWVKKLGDQAWDAGCKMYLKPNLKSWTKEYP